MAGSALPAASRSRLRPFVPRQVRAGPARDIGVARRIAATVLSLDVCGFTAMSERLMVDPRLGAEEIRRRLDSVLAPAVRTILDHGGDVIGFSGDGVTAVFEGGLPAVADLPGRAAAVAAASELQLRGSGGSGVAVRVGVATGEVILAVVGNPAGRLQTVALGVTVDEAMAAQAGAEPGEACLVPYRGAVAFGLDVRSSFRAPLPAFLPSTVAERVIAGRSALLADRRTVTTLFASVTVPCGEAAVAALQQVVLAALPVVHRAGGELRQVDCGDKGVVLMAVFGATTRQYDDERRAVGAGLELVAIEQVNAVGIATGSTFCGALGSGRRRDWLVVGASVNLAARLLAGAPTGAVVVDRATADALPPSSVQVLEPLQLKGIAGPTWVAEASAAESSQPGPTDGVGGAWVDPLVGRREIVDAVSGAWHLPRASGGPVPVAITGPPGIGKSALMAFARSQVETDGGRVVEVRCANGTGPSVWRPGLVEMLGHDGGDREALTTALAAHGISEAAARVPLLAEVLGVDLGESGLTARLDAAHRSALARQLVADVCASTRSAVLVDDARLSDQFTAAVLAAVAAAGVWVVTAGREGAGDDPVATGLVSVRLAGLTEDAAVELLRRRPDNPFPDDVVRRIVQAAAGNPLHLHQLAAHLATRPDPRGDLPGSLRRIIETRLDALSEPDRAVVSVAGVVRTGLTASTLAAVYPALGDPGDLDTRLTGLIAAEILAVDAREGVVFRHALLQEVAYERLPRRARENLHGATAAHLAATAPPGQLRRTEEIARHAGLSRDRRAQRTWFARAAELARASWSLTASASWYRRLAEVSRGQSHTDAQLTASELEIMTGDGVGTAATFRALIPRTAPGSEARARVDHGLGELAVRATGTDEAIKYFEIATQVFARLGRDDLHLRALERLSFAQHRAGRLTDSERTGLQALAVANALRDASGMAEAYGALGLTAWSCGDISLATVRLRRSVSLARRAGNLRCLVHSLSDLAGLLADDGAVVAARRHLAEAEEVARRIGYRRVLLDLLANQGELDRRTGDLGSARGRFIAVFDLAVTSGDLTAAATALGNLGLVAADSGDSRSAARLLRHATLATRQTKNTLLAAEFERALAPLDTNSNEDAPRTAVMTGAEVAAWTGQLVRLRGEPE